MASCRIGQIGSWTNMKLVDTMVELNALRRRGK
jgi:hypothetical protein